MDFVFLYFGLIQLSKYVYKFIISLSLSLNVMTHFWSHWLTKTRLSGLGTSGKISDQGRNQLNKALLSTQ